MLVNYSFKGVLCAGLRRTAEWSRYTDTKKWLESDAWVSLRNFSLSRVHVGEGQIQLLKSNKWNENSRKFIFWMSKGGIVFCYILQLLDEPFWDSFHFPLFFFCWMKLVQMFSNDSLAISLSAEQRVVSEILGPWNQIREYESDGVVTWITDGSELPSRICFGKLKSFMYQKKGAFVKMAHEIVHPNIYSCIVLDDKNTPYWQKQTTGSLLSPMWLIQASCSSLQPSTHVERGLLGHKKVCGLLIFLLFGLVLQNK